MRKGRSHEDFHGVRLLLEGSECSLEACTVERFLQLIRKLNFFMKIETKLKTRQAIKNSPFETPRRKLFVIGLSAGWIDVNESKPLMSNAVEQFMSRGLGFRRQMQAASTKAFSPPTPVQSNAARTRQRDRKKIARQTVSVDQWEWHSM